MRNRPRALPNVLGVSGCAALRGARPIGCHRSTSVLRAGVIASCVPEPSVQGGAAVGGVPIGGRRFGEVLGVVLGDFGVGRRWSNVPLVHASPFTLSPPGRWDQPL